MSQIFLVSQLVALGPLGSWSNWSHAAQTPPVDISCSCERLRRTHESFRLTGDRTQYEYNTVSPFSRRGEDGLQQVNESIQNLGRGVPDHLPQRNSCREQDLLYSERSRDVSVLQSQGHAHLGSLVTRSKP